MSAANGCTLDALVGIFDVVYADPPWRYNFPGTRAKATKDYPTMSTTALCDMRPPVADNAVLYIWAITQSLPQALRVMEAWGFRYKSSAVWDKGRVATGYWWRGQHELLLVGVKGKCQPPPTHLRRSSVMQYPRGMHSAKPPEVRDMIATWFPNARRLEMFAREQAEGWTVWGNEVEANAQISGGTPSAESDCWQSGGAK